MEKQLLSNETIELMNYRIQQEQLSSRIYEYMKMWFENKGYLNLSKLYQKYVEDELQHAEWAKSYLLDFGIAPSLKPLSSPDAEYKSCLEILEATLEHELVITKQVTDLAIKTLKDNNFVLHALAIKYCAEQQEEVSKSITAIDIYKLTSCDLLFDSYVGENLLD